MADEELTRPIPPAEAGVPFSGPAVYANRYYLSAGPSGMRLAFAEQASPDSLPIFRTAVVLTFQDALQLAKVISTIVEPILASLDTATSKKAEGQDG